MHFNEVLNVRMHANNTIATSPFVQFAIGENIFPPVLFPHVLSRVLHEQDIVCKNVLSGENEERRIITSLVFFITFHNVML